MLVEASNDTDMSVFSLASAVEVGPVVEVVAVKVSWVVFVLALSRSIRLLIQYLNAENR